MADPLAKVMADLDAVIAWRRQQADLGRQLVVTNGCFDLLHRGHVDYLNKAREQGDALLVLINSDASIRRVKGPGRPVICEADRVYMLASLACVDAVLIFGTKHCTSQFAKIVPDVYVKGGDYTEETLVQEEYRLLKSQGCAFAFIPFVDGLSTTELLRRIRASVEG